MPDIRPLNLASDRDCTAYIHLMNTVFPEYPASVEGMRYSAKTRAPRLAGERVLVEDEGTLIAAGHFMENDWGKKPGRFSLTFFVAPEHRGKGIGSELFNHLWEGVLVHSPRVVGSWTFEDRDFSLRFLNKRGFKQIMRCPVSRLDLTTFDPSPFREIEARVQESGIRIESLDELERQDPDCRRKLHLMHNLIDEDIPAPEPIEPQTYERFAKLFSSPSFQDQGCFIALDGDTYVGVSFLFDSLADPRQKNQGTTGVIRQYRQRGIATALKLRVASYARSLGADFIQTDNEENNPMFLLNLKLGFVALPAEVAFERNP